jgi:surface carbohydrate biosynthesis protein (TIGR04326 family)
VSNCLFVWDAEGLPPDGDWTVVLWRSFAESAFKSAVSIPKLVEDNADVLKARYLAWIYDLGEKRIDGRRLVDHLELRPGFSYWWMTAIAQKFTYAGSPHITYAIRLMAFDEKWANDQSLGRVVLASSNQELTECMRLWCQKNGIIFDRQHRSKKSTRLSILRSVYKALPNTVKAIIKLILYFIKHWPLRGAGLEKWRQTKGQVTFFSYLLNLDPEAAREGQFESRYWSKLPAILHKEGCNTNWLHIYLVDPLQHPTPRIASQKIDQFNHKGSGEQVHVSLDSFLSARVGFKSLLDWFRLAWAGGKLEPAISAVTSNGLSLWPLYEKEWHESMVGPRAIINFLFLNLFEAAINALPTQQVGIYLYEQQPWELALNHAWKASGHGRLIGAQHTTMLYWDLRYYYDQRSYKQTGGNDLPMPNKVAVNGPVAMNVCLQAGYPEEDLVEVEALRYLSLGETKVETGTVSEHTPVPTKDFMRLLVLGDYLPINTQRQMNMLLQAAPSLPAGIIITVKPHPSCPIHPVDYPDLDMTVTMEPIAKLLAECDVAYTSAATSAAVDAYCAGVPIVSVLDPNTLNLSPLRGCAGALFASTPEELAAALTSAVTTPSTPGNQQEFFTLDQKLPRWKKLLIDSRDPKLPYIFDELWNDKCP